MISRLLIANRGEIACRIIRTARRMGIATVAAYSDADATAMHVGLADSSVRIGPADARESYLDAEAIIAAAKGSAADAIHPGYGFLSESAALSARCAAEGIVFIGPPAEAIGLSGSKVESKRLAREAGLPVINGFSVDLDASPGTVAKQAAEIGYPVLVKASAGGGGRGIRLVRSPDEMKDALEQAAREAEAGFGDAATFVEKALERARHIEVQVIADASGRVAAVGDRDCSLQRRRQKVVEEAPASNLSARTREALHADAVKLAAKMGYRNAGTVEFLVDADEAHYFLEMNARLQVEHPVTEMVYGVDLVEWQIRVAADEPLPESFPPPAAGCAIEVRVCAEIPERDFIPALGIYSHVSWPGQAGPGASVRVDSGIAAGSAATEHYDSLAAKLIVHHPGGRDRCLESMRLALSEARVEGVPTNLSYLAALLDLEPFARGRHTTELLAQREAEIGVACRAVADEAMALGVFCWLREIEAQGEIAGFRLNSRIGTALVNASDGVRSVALRAKKEPDGGLLVADEVGELRLSLSSPRICGDRLGATLDGERMEVDFRVEDLLIGWGVSLRHRGVWRRIVLRAELSAAGASAKKSARAGNCVVAPMHGKLAAMNVKAGDSVEQGETLALLEAMKMEIPVKSPAAGAVAEVFRAAGEQVSMDDPLVRLDGPPED